MLEQQSVMDRVCLGPDCPDCKVHASRFSFWSVAIYLVSTGDARRADGLYGDPVDWVPDYLSPSHVIRVFPRDGRADAELWCRSVNLLLDAGVNRDRVPLGRPGCEGVYRACLLCGLPRSWPG